jgi:outer membrane receptor protein involved in Fe transport
VWEVYGEAELPLLRKIPGAEELTLNVSGRYTDYKSYGSDTTYKMGALYSPVKAVSFRASQGTSYRAPALFEQYQGATSGFLSQQGDPCNNWGVNPNPTRQANCQSEGLAPDFVATTGIQVNSVGGASAGLKAETSKNTTLGIILQPALPTGWGDVSLAVDYFDIKVDNGVNQAGGANILTFCYNDPQFRAGGGFCRLVTRAPVGSNRQLVVNNSHVNLSEDVVKGYDFTVRYVRNIGPGQFRFNGILTKYDEQANKLFPDDPLDSFNGTIGAPKMTGVADFQYTYKAWRFRYGLEWIDKMSSYEFFEQNPETSTFQMATPEYKTHNFSVQYTADKWSVTAGVRNFLNEDLPQISQGFTNLRRGNAPIYSGYDYLGRTYFVNVQYTM